MTLQYPLANIGDKVQAADFGALSVQTAIDSSDGSTSTACRYNLAAKSKSATYALDHDELVFVCDGALVCIFDDVEHSLQAGHCLHIPRGTRRSFENMHSDLVVMTSFIVDAGDIGGAGYAENPPSGEQNSQILHLDDVAPENMAKADGWQITDFRLPFGSHNGVGSTLFRARFFPGAVHAKHRHDKCDEIYHIISGHGLAGAGDDRVEVTQGDFHFIPKGVEHWLHNLDEQDPIEVIGIYLHAGSVAETGYVFMGNVTEEDIQARS